jgi:MFS family permease
LRGSGTARRLGQEYVRSLRVFRQVFANADLRRVELAFAGFSVAESATWVAVGVYAYGAGGASAVGLVSLLLLAPSALIAPFGAALGDRHRRQRVLLLAYLVQAIAAAVAAVAMLHHAALPLVYMAAAVAAWSQTLVRPVQGAMLPGLSSTAADLTAANVALATTRNVSLLVGPLGAGVLLGLAKNPGWVYLAMAAVLLVSAALTVRIESVTASAQSAPMQPMRHALEGFRTVRREPRAGVILALLTAKYVVQGMLRVLLVVVAIDLLQLPQAGVGWLNAALGIGGALGGGVTILLIGRRRLSPAFAAGILLWGIPLVLLDAWPVTISAVIFIGMVGVGRSLMDVSGKTFLARVTPEIAMARVFGVLEALYMAALALGSVVAALLVATEGTRFALGVGGAVLPVVALVLWRSLSASDRGPVVSRDRLDLIMNIPMFAPLSAQAIERLAANLEPLVAMAGTTLITQGDVGDRFYVLDQGEARAEVDGHEVATYTRGDYFGEIALLRDIPRTATIKALSDTKVFALDRTEFLLAVTDHPESLTAAHETAGTRMSATAEILEAPAAHKGTEGSKG